MAVPNLQQWRAAGSPWSPATCIDDFARTLRRRGYTVFVIGNEEHLTAQPPEDHCPFSATPWPGPQPYPRVLACDVMPGGPVDWQRLGERIVADKQANRRGTEWIKYINYTDLNGDVWHASWEPNFAREPSTDTGHIHLSARTDFVNSRTAYDPVAAVLNLTPMSEEDDMGASFGPYEINVTGKTSLTIPPVEAGIADPRETWLNFCNDTDGASYQLRVFLTDGNGGYAPIEGGDGILNLAGGRRLSRKLPRGVAGLVISRAGANPYPGHLTCCLERGPVLNT
jgi:hypothetical protein